MSSSAGLKTSTQQQPHNMRQSDTVVRTGTARSLLHAVMWHKHKSFIKRPARDACLYKGEATQPDPHFLFAVVSHP